MLTLLCIIPSSSLLGYKKMQVELSALASEAFEWRPAMHALRGLTRSVLSFRWLIAAIAIATFSGCAGPKYPPAPRDRRIA